MKRLLPSYTCLLCVLMWCSWGLGKGDEIHLQLLHVFFLIRNGKSDLAIRVNRPILNTILTALPTEWIVLHCWITDQFVFIMLITNWSLCSHRSLMPATLDHHPHWANQRRRGGAWSDTVSMLMIQVTVRCGWIKSMSWTHAWDGSRACAHHVRRYCLTGDPELASRCTPSRKLGPCSFEQYFSANEQCFLLTINQYKHYHKPSGCVFIILCALDRFVTNHKFIFWSMHVWCTEELLPIFGRPPYRPS